MPSVVSPLSGAPSQGATLIMHDVPALAAGGSPGAAIIGQLPLLAAIVAIFYFLVIRPQNQERKKHEELISSLKKDDAVVTQSGIFGRVTRVGGARVELEIATKVRIWVEATSVKARPGDDTPSATDDATGDDAKKGN